MKLICEICKKEFNHKQEQYCIREFIGHIKKTHNLTKYDYTIQYIRGGIIPLCKCGCGNPVKQSKGWNKFATYYNCGHTIQTDSSKSKQKNTLSNKYKSEDWIYSIISKSDLISSLDLYKKGEISLKEAAKKFNIADVRTLTKYWILLNLISKDELKSLLKNSQSKVSAISRKNKWKLNNNVLEYLHNRILNEPGKYTIKSLIKNINELSIFEEIKPRSAYYLIDELIKIYGDDFTHLLQNGYHSKEEISLYNILSWYFGKSNIKIGYKIKYGNNNRECYYYDFLLFNNILIEYDSTGFYHINDNLRDKDKENFAIKNGYTFIRLNKNGAKDIEFLQKLQKLQK